MALSRSVRRTSRWLALATAVASAASIAAAPGASPGAPGVGDPYFPRLGNGGFDALHYDLGVSYRPGSGGSTAGRHSPPAPPRTSPPSTSISRS